MINLANKIRNKKYLVFIDLEATQFSHEAIAIGAVKVEINKDLSPRKIHKGFKTYVIAKEKIGYVVTNLTGITEDTLKKEGVLFPLAQRKLKEYIKEDYEKCAFIAFGNNDLHILKQSLQYNMHSEKDDVIKIAKNYVDFSEIIGEYVRDENGNIYSLINYLKIFEVEPEGEAHDPLFDAKNLFLLYCACLKRIDILEEGYKKILENKSYQPYVVQMVMNKLKKDGVVTKEDYDKFLKDYVSK